MHEEDRLDIYMEEHVGYLVESRPWDEMPTLSDWIGE